MYLKMIFVVVTALVYLISLLLMFVLIWYARTDNSTMKNLKVAGYLNIFKMNDKQVENCIGAWYLAVPGFGWTVLNGIRVFTIAQMAP